MNCWCVYYCVRLIERASSCTRKEVKNEKTSETECTKWQKTDNKRLKMRKPEGGRQTLEQLRWRPSDPPEDGRKWIQQGQRCPRALDRSERRGGTALDRQWRHRATRWRPGLWTMVRLLARDSTSVSYHNKYFLFTFVMHFLSYLLNVTIERIFDACFHWYYQGYQWLENALRKESKSYNNISRITNTTL